MRKNHNFFEASHQAYEQSPLKRIIARFEYILNTYLREFVRLSINDWTEFIRSFTLPNYEKGELWTISPTPLVVIHLSFKMKEKKDDRKGRRNKPSNAKDKKAESDDDPEDD